MDAKTSDWRPGPTVCRCCLTEGCYKDISTEYFWMGKKEVYSEMLSDTFSISIAYSQSGGPNSNSRLICEPCIARLRDASDFRRQVLECEKTFMHHLDPGSSSAADLEIQAETMECEVKLERVKLEKRISDDDLDDRDYLDDDDDDLDDEPLTKLASKVPKKESVDLLDLLDNSKLALKRKSASKAKASAPKKAKTKKESAKPAPSKVTKPEKKKKDMFQAVGRDESEQSDLTPQKDHIDLVKQNASIILKHTTAYPLLHLNKSFRCCFCRCTFGDPCLFRLHVDTNHMNVNRATCLETVRERCTTRVDITNLSCKNCIKTFPSLETVAQHLVRDHALDINLNENLGLVPLKLEKDRFVCVICEKKFPGHNQLYLHAGTHYFRYICDSCGKGYDNRASLRRHVQYAHVANICRYCKKSFSDPKLKKEHVRTNKSCMPFSCNICDERFLSWDHRQEHLENVHGKPKLLFRCSECEKVFQKRISLYFHFKAVHTDDYKCPRCDRKFATNRELREHIHTHTGERPLKCTVCDKTYMKERSLRAHLIVHDDSKKVVCSVCSRLFLTLNKLRLHVKKQHPDVYDREFPNNK